MKSIKNPLNFSLNILNYIVVIYLFDLLYTISIQLLFNSFANNHYFIYAILFLVILFFCFFIHLRLYNFISNIKERTIILSSILGLIILFFSEYYLINYLIDKNITTENLKILEYYGMGNIFSIALKILIIGYYIIVGMYQKSE